MPRTLTSLALILLPAVASAQAADHGAHHPSSSAAAAPTQGGQAAFAAISEIVRLLEADSSTNWARVNIDALRAHLIDMDEVTLHSNVRNRQVAGGIELDITGAGRTAASIQRMLTAHAVEVDALPEYAATATTIPGGVRLRVVAESGSPAVAQRLRGLGFAGILTIGDHHRQHHLMMARGEGTHR